MTSGSSFRSLHDPGQLLVLPNAWDAATARVIEAAGARAIATSSAAVSWAHGVADGEHLERHQVLATVREIVRAVRVPVSVDLEAGYSDVAAEIDALIAELLEIGVTGINLEDGKRPPDVLARKIEIVRATAARLGADLFVNARTDVYLQRLVPAEQALDETLRRLRRYEDAGCDGIFVPALADEVGVRAVLEAAHVPLNLLAVPGLAPVAVLRSWGVRRLSVGALIGRAALAVVRKAAVEVLEAGTYGALFAETIPSAELNALFAPR